MSRVLFGSLSWVLGTRLLTREDTVTSSPQATTSACSRQLLLIFKYKLNSTRDPLKRPQKQRTSKKNLILKTVVRFPYVSEYTSPGHYSPSRWNLSLRRFRLWFSSTYSKLTEDLTYRHLKEPGFCLGSCSRHIIVSDSQSQTVWQNGRSNHLTSKTVFNRYLLR